MSDSRSGKHNGTVDLTPQVALVTGGGRGLGLVIARKLADEVTSAARRLVRDLTSNAAPRDREAEALKARARARARYASRA